VGDGRLTTYVHGLADGVGGLAELGGKGASLARLVAAGLPVPDGFCITTAAHRAFVNEGRMPKRVAAEIVAAYHRLGSPAVAVRSSATAEDLADASFAGQQDTVLGVVGDDPLLNAVCRCWASLWTDRAVAYRARQVIDPSGLGMAVVVQRMVDADAAGVMFTADPLSGDRSKIEINAAWGLGDAVVGGQVNPDSFTVARASGRVTRRVVARQNRPSLTRDQAARLAALGVRIEELYGTPMDVEWCRSGSELSVLQARPITALPGSRDPWNDSRAGDFLWTNTNVGEAVPDVMTPATWSMVQVFLSDAMATASIPPYLGYGRIGGRIYLNVSVMMSLSRAVGVSEQHFRNLTAEVFGELPDDLEIPPIRAGRLAILRAIGPMALHVIGEARRDAKVLDAYLAAHPDRCDGRRADIAAITNGPDLALLWTEVLDPEFNKISWMLSAATRSSGASFITTRMRLQRLLGDAGANALTSGLGGQQGQLASLGLLDGLDQLARGTIDRHTFNRRFGHRGPHEFEISTPRPAEDPDWIDNQLDQRSASTGPGYRELLAAQERRRDEAWAELELRHPWQARTLHHQLAAWAKIARDRERARSEVIRYLWVLRAYALRAGELTGLGPDIFFLEAAEIERALWGETISPAVVGQRRSAYQGYCALPNYPALIRGRFDPYAWAADPNRRSDRWVQGGSGPEDAAVRGFPGSAGVVEGPVRVLDDAGDGAQVRSGEVLVTTVTNVGWTPLFPRLAAVVTDVGAPLSHAAIVARELGIPAVVGCGNATMRLKSGDRVRVDGSAGTVEVLA
jgi:phosphohistidine swiveling domain-containing protein